MAYAFIQTVAISDFSGAAYGTISTPGFSSNIQTASSIVAAATSSTNEAPTVTDTLLNTFANVDLIFDGIDNQSLSSFLAFNSGTGPDTVAASFGSNSAAFVGLYAAEYSGLATTNPLQDHKANTRLTVGDSSTVETDAMTPTSQPACVWGVCMEDSVGTGAPAAGAGFISRGTTWNLGLDLARVEDERITSTATAKASFTTVASGGPSNYLVAGMVLTEAAVAAATLWHNHCAISIARP
jgi:hypothetical protein